MIFGLAPMDGITDLPFRSIVNHIFNTYQNSPQKSPHLPPKSPPSLWCRTEFMNTDGYMIQPAKMIKHLIHHDQESKLIAQIYGGNMDTLVKTAIDIDQKYPTFWGIELNIGCPSPKVMACGG